MGVSAFQILMEPAADDDANRRPPEDQARLQTRDRCPGKYLCSSSVWFPMSQLSMRPSRVPVARVESRGEKESAWMPIALGSISTKPCGIHRVFWNRRNVRNVPVRSAAAMYARSGEHATDTLVLTAASSVAISSCFRKYQ